VREGRIAGTGTGPSESRPTLAGATIAMQITPIVIDVPLVAIAIANVVVAIHLVVVNIAIVMPDVTTHGLGLGAVPAVLPVVLTQLSHVLVSVELVVVNVTIVPANIAVVSIAVLTILPKILAIPMSIDLSRRGIRTLRRSADSQQAG